MVKTLKVILWDEEVGRLSWDDKRQMSYFTYNPTFVHRGIDISPLWASIRNNRGLMPIWGEEQRIYQKLPAFLADSLPDSWGNQLFDLWRQQNHLSNTEISPLDKLSFIGRRGMGALEFVPEYERSKKSERIDVNSLVALAERIFTEREEAQILPEESLTMQSLLTVGTSAGGRQPKAIIAINSADGEIRSGQISDLDGYDYYLLKFGNADFNSAELEMTYYELAVKAGINMMHSELLMVDGSKHFMTQRFDRKDGKKLHTQTLAAMYPEANSYEQLISVCRSLHLPEADCEEVYRRMIFNVLANNTDDHNKNFSFLMDESGKWQLSPAYDMTYIFNTGGFLPEKMHCMMMQGKLQGQTLEDALALGKENGIRKAESIIGEVASAIRQFRHFAEECEVSQRWIGAVETTLNQHLAEWGLLERRKNVAFRIGETLFEKVRVEKTYKGNYHLLCEVDGKERKFVITGKKEEYALIDRVGTENLTDEQLYSLVESFFVR